MKKLSIIILSYNVKKLLANCLQSIPYHSDWETIVIDNKSNDGSPEFVRKNFPTVVLIENKENLGFAAGNNIAINKSNSKYVLLLNPDTLVHSQTIETVLDFLESNDSVAAATCRIELPNGKLDYSCHRGFPTPFGALTHFIGLKMMSSYTHQKVPNTIHEIDALTGAFALVRRSSGDKVGWLDEEYYWNGEDLDFCYKLKEAGWKVMYIPQVKITHFKGSSSQANRDTKIRWATNSTQVMRLFYRKHLAAKHNIFTNLAVFAGIWFVEKLRLLKAHL